MARARRAMREQSCIRQLCQAPCRHWLQSLDGVGEADTELARVRIVCIQSEAGVQSSVIRNLAVVADGEMAV